MKRKLMLALTTAMTAGAMLAADAAAGKTVYDASCKKCHAADGAGVPAIAKMLKVEMKHLGSKEVLGKADAALVKDIKSGVGKMKAVAVPDADAANVVAFMRTLKK